MSIWISAQFKKSFSVAVARQQAWDLVSDVPRSASNIPELTSCEPISASAKGNPVFRFSYKKVGIDRWSQDPWHNSEFLVDVDRWQIDWDTAKGDGTIRQCGRWILEGDEENTVLHLTVDVDMELPVPRIVKLTATPLVRKIFLTRMEQYTQNITAVLQG